MNLIERLGCVAVETLVISILLNLTMNKLQDIYYKIKYFIEDYNE